MVSVPSAVVACAYFQGSHWSLLSLEPWSWKFTNLSALWRKLTTWPSSMATTSPAPLPAAIFWVSLVLYCAEVALGGLDDLDPRVVLLELVVELLVAEVAEHVDPEGLGVGALGVVAAAGEGGGGE